ncbi:putative peptide/nitrate transporter [Platanthera guangdongensis]|uniref:Peptide/nitrate transporter n=1 Tax=Platanthera guangdongensis TaxID=2320717 RepID=A0ABR2MA86_9ASPA
MLPARPPHANVHYTLPDRDRVRGDCTVQCSVQRLRVHQHSRMHLDGSVDTLSAVRCAALHGAVQPSPSPPPLPIVTGPFGYEAFERMAFYGVAANLVVYLTTQLHEDTVTSVRSVNNWSGSVWITPILGAFIADSYFGRFWTFTISSLIYVLVRIIALLVFEASIIVFKTLRALMPL